MRSQWTLLLTLALAWACEDRTALAQPSQLGEEPAGRYRVVGAKADHSTRARLVVTARGDGTFQVARQSECKTTGRTHVLRGIGRIRRGVLLVEFPSLDPSPSERADDRSANGAPAAPRAPEASGPLSGGATGALEKIGGTPAPGSAASKPELESASEPEPEGPALVIQGSVGEEGVNRPEDVRIIQAALLRRGYLEAGGFTPGASDARLVAAIRRYQAERAGFRWPDGRVDVDNRTIRAMNREGIDPRPGAPPQDPASAPARAGQLDSAADAGRSDPQALGAGDDVFADPAFDDAMDDADLGPGSELPDPSSLFPNLPANAVLAVYLVREGRLQGAVHDPACGGDARRWTMERGLRLDEQPEEEAAAPEANDAVRGRIARIASQYPGYGWRFPETREVYAELLFPFDSEFNKRAFAESMSSCGLFAMAVLRELGKDHRSLQVPYAVQIGSAVSNIVSIARADDAWVTASADAAPRQGDMVIVGHVSDASYGGTTHVAVVTGVAGDQVTSVDGGQPHIAERTRTLSRRGSQLWLGGRRVQGWLDAGRLKLD